MKSPCRCWPGHSIDEVDYTRITVDGRSVLAHRWVYEQARGPIPLGLELDHLCMRKPCIELSHLEAVSHQENMRRAGAAGVLGRGPASRTHCPQGHPYDEVNTMHEARGRACRECKRQRRRAWGMANRAYRAMKERERRAARR